MFFTVFISGWFGCRLLNIILRLREVAAHPDPMLWIVSQAGVWYGAIAGGLIAGYVLCRRHGLDPWVGFDVAAVPAAVGGAVGRLGCLLSGCCYGTRTDLPWGIVYRDHFAHAIHPDLPSVPLHPTPLYEIGAVLLMAILLDRVGARHPRAGSVGLLWIVVYALARCAIEPFRGDLIRGVAFGVVSTSQVIGLLAAAVACGVLLFRACASIPDGAVPRRLGPQKRPLRGRVRTA